LCAFVFAVEVLAMPDSSILGALDLFVIGGVTGLLLYYFVFRKKQQEKPSYKKLTVG